MRADVLVASLAVFALADTDLVYMGTLNETAGVACSDKDPCRRRIELDIYPSRPVYDEDFGPLIVATPPPRPGGALPMSVEIPQAGILVPVP